MNKNQKVEVHGFIFDVPIPNSYIINDKNETYKCRQIFNRFKVVLSEIKSCSVDEDVIVPWCVFQQGRRRYIRLFLMIRSEMSSIKIFSQLYHPELYGFNCWHFDFQANRVYWKNPLNYNFMEMKLYSFDAIADWQCRIKLLRVKNPTRLLPEYFYHPFEML